MVKSVFSVFTGGASSKNQIKGNCLSRKHWAAFIFYNIEYSASSNFNQKCDFSGTFNPKINQYFPISFNINPNITDVNNFSGKLKIIKKPSATHSYYIVSLFLEGGEFVYKNGEKVLLSGEYEIILNPSSGRNTSSANAEKSNNLGGSYLVTHFKGVDVEVKRSIKLLNEYLF